MTCKKIIRKSVPSGALTLFSGQPQYYDARHEGHSVELMPKRRDRSRRLGIHGNETPYP
jgi:hypothetical protein